MAVDVANTQHKEVKMISFNMTNFTNMTYQQILNQAHSSIAVPELIALFIGVFIIVFIIGLLLVKGAQSKIKFVGVWVLSLVLSFILLMCFILLPTTMQKVINFFTDIFK